ncbi:MAG: hypothetical protein JSV43_04600 [Methanobacteriota archaeon]|nr:MAG: hypothetical protein JSV43_04600 [Euryarchaeota archaeon]
MRDNPIIAGFILIVIGISLLLMAMFGGSGNWPISIIFMMISPIFIGGGVLF